MNSESDPLPLSPPGKSKKPWVRRTSTTPPERSGSFSAAAWDATGVALVAFQDIAANSGIPFLAPVATLGLQIFNLVQNAGDNKCAFVQLGLSACELVAVVESTCKDLGAEGVEGMLAENVSLGNHLKKLVDTLQDIKVFLDSKMSRNSLIRVMTSRGDVAKVQEFRDRIRQAMDVFNLQSNIALRDSINRMAKKQETFYDSFNTRKFAEDQGSESSREQRQMEESRPTPTVSVPDGRSRSRQTTEDTLSDSPHEFDKADPEHESAPWMKASPTRSSTFPGISAGSINGGTFNNIGGNYSVVMNNGHSTQSNYGNTYNTNTVDSFNYNFGLPAPPSPTVRRGRFRGEVHQPRGRIAIREATI